MKWLWAGTSGLCLAYWLANAGAGEPQWRPATPPSVSSAGVTLGRPIAADTDTVSPTGQTIPGSSLVRASYASPASAELPPLIRAQSAEDGSGFAVDSYPTGGPIHSFVGTPVVQSPPTFAPSPALQGHPVQSTVALPGGSTPVDCSDNACGDSACCAQECCPHGGRLYGSAEYLLWWISPGPAPVLFSTGPATSTNPAALGFPGNGPTFGGPLDYGAFSGGRFTLGYWFDPCQTWAVEGRFFFLGQQTTQFSAPPDPVGGRPFISQNNVSMAELFNFPGVIDGTAVVKSSSQLWGAEANLRTDVCSGCWGHWDLFGGFRYLDLRENLTITEQTVFVHDEPPFVAGDHVGAIDSFSTRNQFYGGQLGSEVELRAGKWFTDIRAAVALGDMHQIVNINGSETIIAPGGGVQVLPGGLLALPSNIGEFARNRFAVVPEMGINFGYKFTENFRVFVGYTGLYMSNVVRPGDQIDVVLNTNQIPPTGHPVAGGPPTVPFKSTDLWAQGVNFGFELRY
jgi:Putative beta barrel porin-7 (BBP7)